MAERRWLVTGCSSGLGWALAHRLAAAGQPVLATARDITALASLRDHGPHVAVSALDVREPRHCAAAISLAVERFGGVDVLVNNAGYGQFGVVEEVSDDELAYEPVVAGMLAALRALGGEDSQLSPPSLFAEVVSRLAELSNPPFRLPLGTGAVDYLDAVLTGRRAQLDQAKGGLVDRVPDPA